MTQLQFKNYIFEHNPKKITINHSAALPAHFAPYHGTYLQNMGFKGSIIRCEGAFLGKNIEDCTRQLTGFLSTAKEKRRGTLFLPAIDPMTAYVSSVSFSQEGQGDCILYTIEFVEDMSPDSRLTTGGNL